jgi:two-component system, NtrC family, response regulator HydG
MKNSDDKTKLLVVDDAPDTLEIIKRNLVAAGFQVFTAPGVAEALEILDRTAVDLVITDLKMPKISGLDLVRHVRENLRDTEVVMITGYPTIGSAVEAIKNGAEDYLTKPFTDEELLAAVQKALDKLSLRGTSTISMSGSAPVFKGIFGESKAMSEVFRDIKKAASTNAHVLIYGESGTGKELVARAIHYSSSRSAAPFVPINCGGIPDGLIESELFGHVKGAFTGAVESRAGFFQIADRGTLFLDEISEIPIQMQVKLLRVLQDREVYMVGSNRSIKVDIRIISATNKKLTELIPKGLFREDLYFRLNVIAIEIPPLRERENDLLLLAHYFAVKFAKEFERPIPHFSDSVLKAFKQYTWPGNVRELENIIQRIVILHEGENVDISDLPASMRYSGLGVKNYSRTLADVEKEYIRNVLESVGGNKTQAAKILGIDRKTLREKLDPLK